MNNKLILISLLLFFAIGVKGQEITQDSLTIDEKTTLLPEVVVSGHPTKKQSSFTFNKTELQLAGVKDSDMSFKPGGFLKRLFSFLFKKKRKESSFEKNERILREYDNYLPPKEETITKP